MTDDKRDPEEQKPRSWLASTRTLIIIVLVGIGIAVFAGMKAAKSRPSSVPTATPSDSSWEYWPWVLVVLGISYLWAARQSRRYAALGKLNEDAVRLIDAGELASASRLLDEALNACDPSYACRGIWEFNRGLAHMRQGHLDIAIASFEAALRNKGVLVGAEQFLTRLRCQLAIAHAIHGEFTAAEQAEARAHDRAAPDMNGALLFMHILIGVRAGRYATMVKDAADEWPKAEGCLDVHQYKIMRLLLAFGHSQLPDAPAHAQHIQQMLAGVHPFRPGEFDYLVVNWPEFRAFLVEHGFVTQNSVPQPAAAPANLKSAT